MTTEYEKMRERQGLVDAAADTLVELLDAMQAYERSLPQPQKWDEEYAPHSINDCIDRMFCAPAAGMPKPSDRIRTLYREVRERAAPFLDEGVPLPGSIEEDVERRAREIYAARWPERPGWDVLARDDLIRRAVEEEALRDALLGRRA